MNNTQYIVSSDVNVEGSVSVTIKFCNYSIREAIDKFPIHIIAGINIHEANGRSIARFN